MNARRYRPERVLPLEVWDAMVLGRPLYLVPPAELPYAIVELVSQLRTGTARRERGKLLPRLAIDSVVLGGGAPLAAICNELVRHGVPARIFEEPLWIAEPGGRALLSTLGAARPYAVLDVGQTSLKLSVAGERQRLMRPLQEIPIEVEGAMNEASPYRERILKFLATSLEHASQVNGLVLALPCEIDDDLTVAGCSYPWPDGDRTLVRELLHEARLTHAPCLVLNDAELAAVSVGLNADASATLVLTVGLGVGSAYLERAERHVIAHVE